MLPPNTSFGSGLRQICEQMFHSSANTSPSLQVIQLEQDYESIPRIQTGRFYRPK